jgi:glucokinase
MLAEYGARTGGDAAHLAQVARSAADGDHVAAAVLAEGAAALGGVLGGLVNVIDPDIVLVGGGVAESGDAWWRPLRAAFAAELLPALRDVVIEPAALGATAALLGAARLAMEAIA